MSTVCTSLQHTVNPAAASRALTHPLGPSHFPSAPTHCNTCQQSATPCNTLQHTAIQCNVLQHTTDLLFHRALSLTHYFSATYCNTLQQSATPCNTLQTCCCITRSCWLNLAFSISWRVSIICNSRRSKCASFCLSWWSVCICVCVCV